MPADSMAESIVRKALALGYEGCGIVSVADTLDYAEKLRERVERIPVDAKKNSELYRFVRVSETYPWAKSVVVCARRYGKYRIPENTEGIFAKYYLMDSRKNEDSSGYRDSLAFEQHLHALGLKTETERKFGVTALRWAAFKAGLGLIRRNNFFYTNHSGSWVHLEAWLTDRAMEFKNEGVHKPCPASCNRCIAACPTKSLCEPYTMGRSACVSALTTWTGDDLINEPNNRQMGRWIYGCDACQDACPYNAGKWSEDEEFPGLSNLMEIMTPENIIGMDYEFLRRVVQPKFWYIAPERLWKWKINALNAMRNEYSEKYDNAIAAACADPDERVRTTAVWVRDSVVDGMAPK